MAKEEMLQKMYEIQRYFMYAVNGVDAVGDDFDEEKLLEKCSLIIDKLEE